MEPQKFIVAAMLIILITPALEAGSRYYSLGRRYYTNRNYTKAREMFIKDIELSKRGNSYYFLGEIEKKEGNFEKAEEYFLEAIDKYLSKSYKKNAFWNLIVIAEQRGDYSGTIKYCKLAYEKNKDDGARSKAEGIINKSLWSDNAQAVSLYKKAIKYKNRNKPEEARKLLLKALDEDPEFMAPRFELGAYYYRKGDNSKSWEYIEPVVKAIPFYAEAAIIAGDIAFTRKNYEQAAIYFKAALDHGFLGSKTEYVLHIKKGTSNYKTGNYQEAEKDFRELLAMGNRSSRLLSLLSATLIRQNREKEALTFLTRLYKNNPHNKSLIVQIGTIYYRLDDDQYSYYFNRLFQICKKDENCGNRYDQPFKILLKHSHKTGNHSRVISLYKHLTSSSRTHEISLLAAHSAYKTGRYDMSVEILEGLSLQKEDSILLAKSYVRAKRNIKARIYISELIQQYGQDESIVKDPVIGPLARKLIPPGTQEGQ